MLMLDFSFLYVKDFPYHLFWDEKINENKNGNMEKKMADIIA